MTYPRDFEDKIDFTAVRRELKHKCLCLLGERRCDEMHFSARFNDVTLWLDQTAEMLALLESNAQLPTEHYIDCTQLLSSIRAQGSMLIEQELHSLRLSLSAITAVAKFFENNNDVTTRCPHLKELTAGMQTFPEIESAISQILDKFGNIRDNASPQLSTITRQIASTTASIATLMRRVVTAAKAAGYLDKDAAPSVRDGRLVIPVSPTHKRQINGIVHDESASGRTVFIEPAEVVEANNTIRELENERRREIIRILTETAALIRPHISEMLESYETLGQIDFMRAKALYAQQTGGCRPHVEPKAQIEWYHAVHPVLLLSLTAQGKETIPLNIELGGNNRILLISGPNAGGKSVCLKTVAIVQFMAQCGMLPPAYYNSHFGIFDDIMIDIGDEQSIENDLSTYSSHLTNMKTFLSKASERSLILIDEFGTGTEPQIGGAIAQAILDRINRQRVMGVITTHYQNLKHFAEQTEGIVNGAMLYDRQQMRPLFQLSIGYPGSSFAIEIARKIGLPADVVAEAQKIVGSDYIDMDKHLLDIARDRRYWQSKRQQIHDREKRLSQLTDQYEAAINELRTEQRRILKAAHDEAKEILAKSNATVERTIREIREAEAEKETTKRLRQQIENLKTKLENEELAVKPITTSIKVPHQPKTKKEMTPIKKKATISLGDIVKIDGTDAKATVIDIDGREAIVAMGTNITSRIPLARLTKTTGNSNGSLTRREPPQEIITAANNSAYTDDSRKRQLKFNPQIDIRGFRTDEAIQVVTYFIDDAIQFNAGRVRILHGTGNGILRQFVRQYLSTVKGISGYHDEDVRFGGAGITVVDI